MQIIIKRIPIGQCQPHIEEVGNPNGKNGTDYADRRLPFKRSFFAHPGKPTPTVGKIEGERKHQKENGGNASQSADGMAQDSIHAI
jgi:hypothetical protein